MPSKSIVDVQVAIALAEMEVRTAGLTGEALRAELTKFMNEQSVAAEGKVTMLWAGYGKVADRIAEVDNPDIRILNKTVANKVLASPDFMDKVADSFGYDRVEFATYNPESDMGKDKTKLSIGRIRAIIP